MKNDLINHIDEYIDNCTEELISTLIKLVNIKSEAETPENGAPFGAGPKKVLDTIMSMGKTEGFYCTDYDVGVISLALEDCKPDLGIWLHGDVVPAGEGWSFDPYNATRYEGWVIGRGASDNKGSIAVMFMLFKIFKSLGIKLSYNPAMYVGSNEETGMADMIGIPNNPSAKGFLNVFTPPKMSLVPDGGKFPVGYGGKGGVTVYLKSNNPLKELTITAGKTESPGTATAIYDKELSISGDFESCSVTYGEKKRISAYSPPRHASNPDPNGNMITILMNALLNADGICKNDAAIISFFKKISLDVYGEFLNINTENKIMGPLTVFSYGIECFEGYPEIKLRIRYPKGIAYEEMIKRISGVAEKNDFYVSKSVSGVEPYLMNEKSEVIKKLTTIANEVTGDTASPFIMSGGTYAHRLPNALVYGLDGCRPPKEFPDGVGCAHGIDEAVSIKNLKRAMKIYARALLELQEMCW